MWVNVLLVLLPRTTPRGQHVMADPAAPDPGIRQPLHVRRPPRPRPRGSLDQPVREHLTSGLRPTGLTPQPP